MRRICIIGLAAPSRDWALEQPAGVELWGLNETFNISGLPQLDRLFNMHPRDWREQERKDRNDGVLPRPYEPNCFGRGFPYVEFLRDTSIPVYAQQEWWDIPASIEYPFEDVRRSVGIKHRQASEPDALYATNTVSYMLALALTEHMWGDTISEIRMAGIELQAGREMWIEKPCVEFYLGMARGMGIEVLRSPYWSGILDGHRYALDPYPDLPPEIKDYESSYSDAWYEQMTAKEQETAGSAELYRV